MGGQWAYTLRVQSFQSFQSSSGSKLERFELNYDEAHSSALRDIAIFPGHE